MFRSKKQLLSTAVIAAAMMVTSSSAFAVTTYYTNNGNNTPLNNVTGGSQSQNDTYLAQLILPVGTYLLQATVKLSTTADTVANQNVDCHFEAPAGKLFGGENTNVGTGAGAVSEAIINVNTTYTLSATTGTIVYLACSGSYRGPVANIASTTAFIIAAPITQKVQVIIPKP